MALASTARGMIQFALMGGSKPAQFAVIGLGAMGRNLALNLAEQGVHTLLWDRDSAARERCAGAGPPIAADPPALLAALERPRRILLMIPAGPPVDEAIALLRPGLAEGDLLIDGGNSWFEDTRRRGAELHLDGLELLGAGISGGSEGARHGPAIMVGGAQLAFNAVEPILAAIAARTASGPCLTLVGPDGAGHFAKMVHNGIEYAFMQLIAETWDLLRRDRSSEELADLFERWNEGPLHSYLIGLSARILRVRDARTARPLLELVRDEAGQKGTGRWSVRAAHELGVPLPIISAAVDARLVSSCIPVRRGARTALGEPQRTSAVPLPPESLHDALYAAVLAAYAQGFHLLHAASREYHWSINSAEIARIWQGGCILQARLLEEFHAACRRERDLPSPLLDARLGGAVRERLPALRAVLAAAQRAAIPTPALGAALAYLDALRSADLPQSLIQAQRDAFGAHTYRRRDDPRGEPVHSEWLEKSK